MTLLLVIGNCSFAQEKDQVNKRVSSVQQYDSTQYLIINGQVGNFKIGSTPDELYSIFEFEQIELVDLFIEGFYSPAMQVIENDMLSLVAEIDCNKVYRIRIYNELYHTSKNVRVGSSYKELRSQYTISEILVGEGSVYAHIDELNMSFELNLAQDNSDSLTIDNIADDVEISSILVL